MACVIRPGCRMWSGRVGSINPPSGGRVQGFCGQVSDPVPPDYRNNRCKSTEGCQWATWGGRESKLLGVAMEEGQYMGPDTQIGSRFRGWQGDVPVKPLPPGDVLARGKTSVKGGPSWHCIRPKVLWRTCGRQKAEQETPPWTCILLVTRLKLQQVISLSEFKFDYFCPSLSSGIIIIFDLSSGSSHIHEINVCNKCSF